MIACFLGLAALAGALAFGVGTASAEVTHPFLSSITECKGEALGLPRGLTFDSSGNLFVAEPEPGKIIDEYNSANSCINQIGAGLFPEEFTNSVAVNNTTGVVYAAESGEPETIFVFKPEGEGKYKVIQKATMEAAQSGFMMVAYDNSSGPHAGDLYVVVGAVHLDVLETDAEGKLGEGNAEEVIEEPEALTPPPGVELFGLTGSQGRGGIAVDATNGDLFVAEPRHEAVSVYNGDGTFQKRLTTPTAPCKAFEPIGVAVEESTGDFYVIDGKHSVVYQFSSSGECLGQTAGVSKAEPFEAPVGIAVQNAGPTKGEVYVAESGKIDIFEAAAAPPPNEFALVAEDTGTGSGSVTGSGINCGATCTVKVAEGAAVSLTATPEGSKFVEWAGEECAGVKTTTCEFTMPAKEVHVKAVFEKEKSGTPEFPLTVAKTGTGSGLVVSSPAGINCGATCTADFAEGEVVKLTASADPGSKFVEWSGEECAGVKTTTCEFTMPSKAVSVSAEFSLLPKFPLTVEKTGAGSVKSTPSGINCGATCTAEFAEGEVVKLTATADLGSTFVEWSGEECAGVKTTTCEFTMPAKAVNVKALFEETAEAPIKVVKYGEGTVVSTPAGINCGAQCEASFAAGPVTLTETPAAGYEFAGWIGCKSTGATTCEVNLIAATEVSAVFLRSGKEGQEGKEGAEGASGKEGPAGKEGPIGKQGAVGPVGEEGKEGKPGPAGPAGPAGAQGPAGPSGKVQLVKCTTVKQGKKKVQKCTTQLVSGPVTFKATGTAAHATLARHGVVYASGLGRVVGGHLSLRLKALRKLRSGHYTLTLISGSGRHETIRSESFTLR